MKLRRRIFNPLRPPSGSIPRFPIWEVVVLFFVVFFGVIGLVTPDSSNASTVLGSWSVVWSASFLVSGLLSLIGLAIPAPNGLVINLIGMLTLCISAGAYAIAVIFLVDSIVFAGSTSLYVFTVGAGFRTSQLMHQLYLLREGIQRLSNDPREYI